MTAGTHPGATLEAPRLRAVWAAGALAAGAAAGLARSSSPSRSSPSSPWPAWRWPPWSSPTADWALGTVAAFAVLNLANVATDFHGAPSLVQPLLALVALGIAFRWLARGERPVGGGRAAAFVAVYAAVAVASLLVAADFAAGRTEVENLLKDAVLAVLAGLLLRRDADAAPGDLGAGGRRGAARHHLRLPGSSPAPSAPLRFCVGILTLSICTIGRANAAVLPVPVWAPASRSQPSKITGIARVWMGVGSV